MRGFLIAGVRSGVGKTTIAMGLMKCFKNVSPFKVGPDYIDGKFHEYVTSNKSYNLDYILMGEKGIKRTFLKNSKEISIVEGVMGLYDGRGVELDNGSSAHIGRILDLPVILVVDGRKISTSIAAEVLGYRDLDRRVKLKGVIINKISSKKTYDILKESIEKYCDIKCIGYMLNIENIGIEERHLGLMQAQEIKDLDIKVEKISKQMKETIDLDYIYNISKIKEMKDNFFLQEIMEKKKNEYTGMKIAIAKDEAFSFYYNDNIEFLEELGIEIIYFSPVHDKKIPKDINMLYFGGGYPENYSKELSENKSMINSIRDFFNKNGVIYGECGGFIYLSDTLETLDGKKYDFVGISGSNIKMKNRLNIKRFGYIDIEYNGKFKGRGHEFHYSEIISSDENIRKEFKIRKPDGRNWTCGFHVKNVLCGYPHIHFFKSQDIIFDLLNKAKESK
ncbi:cobyrinate a,c-diamide synthase [Fusobacterium sp. IOR10]|uniref:cobyrinate a,c-diamide synthase n=1 Tax=Fusobacterium sp. IOR10 TaxID=2665157 RepID=UPI0013D1D6D3|nr:cobyrinate a,c-diamide synthase [Fusobacterium sp. IOR10]